MREFLFRGKTDYLDVRNKWKYGYYVHEENDFIGYYNKNHCLFCYDLIDIKTLGQYTGIKDKNGKKIFEGDILRDLPKDKWEETSYIAYEVFWHDNDCCDHHIGWQIEREHPQGNLAGSINLIRKFSPQYVNKMIVIGNIYDNPELLK